VPELLADLWDLGGWYEVIVELLRPLGLPAGDTRVLDLGCGKGAVSIHLAEHLGFQSHGVDFFTPFVEDGRSRAEEHGVKHLCTFEVADMREAVDRLEGFDAAVYASVGGVLGDHSSTVRLIRQTVRPGGYIVVDDGYLAGSEQPDQSGWGHYVSHDETVKRLTVHGDDLIREVRIPAEDRLAIDQRYFEAIARRASAIAERHPDLADALTRHVELQRKEGRVWERRVESALWLLRRA
jgi:cyclopropane fatty-acyl-phospholipid synthase-like methyltransferase